MKRVFYITILALLLPFVGLNAKSLNPTKVEVERLTPNPSGVGFGFWARNIGGSRDILQHFGRRPYERWGFVSWSAIESERGRYNTAGVIKAIQEIQLLGSTPIISLNSIKGPWFLDSFGSQIPPHYTQDITNAKTLAAAKRYISHMVRTILDECGQAYLTFDYEMMWHCKPDTPAKQKILRDWFLEAVATARSVATEMGMEDRLIIMPIVNGKATSDDFCLKHLNSPYRGHQPAQWLLDMVAVCDIFAIDTYNFDPKSPADPFVTIDTWEFWIKHYSMGKPVLITEVGFSTANEVSPSFKTAYHAAGTEQQQAQFYRNVIEEMMRENHVGGRMNGQVRSLCVWMYSDYNTGKPNALLEDNFGVVKRDGMPKPAFYELQKLFKRYETDTHFTPFTISELNAKRIETTYRNGVEMDRVVAQFRVQAEQRYTLHIKLQNKGGVVIEADGKWYRATNITDAKIELSPTTTDRLTINIYPTGARVPFVQTIERITIE